jgi:hypothetical protein
MPAVASAPPLPLAPPPAPWPAVVAAMPEDPAFELGSGRWGAVPPLQPIVSKPIKAMEALPSVVI